MKSGDKCPKCEKGKMKEEKYPIDSTVVTLPDGTRKVLKKYFYYLICTNCENNISVGKKGWE